MNKQSGLSLVELVVSAALLGLVLYLGFSMTNVPNTLRGRIQKNNVQTEKYQQAFNAFYKLYNQNGETNSYTSQIEALNASAISIRFTSNPVPFTIGSDNTYIEIGNGDLALNDLLKYQVLTQPEENESLCKLTQPNSGSGLWSYSCPNNSNLGISVAWQNNQITEMPITMIDGRICYVVEVNNPTNTLRIDNSRNNCEFTSTANAAPLMFILPRLIVFSSDGLFNQAVFESFYHPKERFGDKHYPQN
jgi:type II secretory pathway pseudopilin PulG